MNKIIYTEKSRQDLRKLDLTVTQRIITKIKFFGEQKKPLDFARKLTDSRLGTYRFRIGDYRAIFDIDKNNQLLILYILRIKHRKDIYDL